MDLKFWQSDRPGGLYAGYPGAAEAQEARQPGRSIAPADPATEMPDAALQIAGRCATPFVSAWPDQQCVPLSAEPFVGSAASVIRTWAFSLWNEVAGVENMQ